MEPAGPGVPSTGLPSAWDGGAAWWQRPRLCSVDPAEGSMAAASGAVTGCGPLFQRSGSFLTEPQAVPGPGQPQSLGPFLGGTQGAPTPPPAPTPPGGSARVEDLRPGDVAPWLRPRMRGSWGL